MTPRPLLLTVVLVALFPLVLGIWAPRIVAIGMALNVIVVVVAAFDLIITPRSRSVLVEREVSEVLSVGCDNPVELHFSNRTDLTLELEFIDEWPRPGDVTGVISKIKLAPWKNGVTRYQLRPHRRGHDRFAGIYLRYTSRMRLWSIVERRRLETKVRIYPDIRAVYRYELMAQRNRLAELGLKTHRLRGQGGEFERLRDYRREDEIRHIDWKATAKHERLISREFDVERNQNIMIMLDCGRSMRNESDGVSHLDFGLNAAIMLSYIALSQGDNVAFMAFSSRIERAVRPLRGKPAIQTIIRHTFDLEPREDASDYGLAVEDFMRWQRRRSLVILITHVMDEQHLDNITRYVRTLRSPHMLLCVFLHDVVLSSLASRVPDTDIEAFHVAAASELLAAQTRKVAELRERGVLVLESLPSQLSAQLINQYLDLKARHLM